jgi:polyisoprenoid-binding protein YceI
MKKIAVAFIALMVLVGCGTTDQTNVETPVSASVQTEVAQTTTLTSMESKNLVDIEVSSAVNLDESIVEWKGGKIVAGDHWGTVKIQSADLEFDDKKITTGTVVIDMNSMTVTDLKGSGAKKLIDHFMNDDFFAVEAHPQAVMEFNEVDYTSETTATASGNLTIKDITKPVTFDFIVDENKFMAELVLDRTDWNIRYGSGKFFENLGDKAIKDEMELKVTLVMNNTSE